MTISQSLALWLFASGLFPGSEGVSVDLLGPEEGACAVLIAQTRALPFRDGSRECSCRFHLLLRAASQTESARRRARSLLESVRAWVREQNASGSLPELSGRRICLSAAADDPGAVSGRTDAQAVYRLPIDVVYWEG